MAGGGMGSMTVGQQHCSTSLQPRPVRLRHWWGKLVSAVEGAGWVQSAERHHLPPLPFLLPPYSLVTYRHVFTLAPQHAGTGIYSLQPSA